jgi:L-rhamnose-H+ transport protein
MNVALAYGAPLIQRAAELGIQPASRTNVIWPLVLTATLVPYLIYCFYLWRKNQSWRFYAAPGTAHYWFLGAVMGILWTGSVILYGYCSTLLGHLGPVLGWPLFMSVIIVTSNVWGILTGEWKGVAPRTFGAMLGGILLLVLGFCTVAVASA